LGKSAKISERTRGSENLLRLPESGPVWVSNIPFFFSKYLKSLLTMGIKKKLIN
jgi:hypothetical protein